MIPNVSVPSVRHAALECTDDGPYACRCGCRLRMDEEPQPGRPQYNCFLSWSLCLFFNNAVRIAHSPHQSSQACRWVSSPLLLILTWPVATSLSARVLFLDRVKLPFVSSARCGPPAPWFVDPRCSILHPPTLHTVRRAVALHSFSGGGCL